MLASLDPHTQSRTLDLGQFEQDVPGKQHKEKSSKNSDTTNFITTDK